MSLKQAVLKSLASDGGLYMPEKIPQMEQGFFQNIENFSFQEISFAVAKKFLGDDISDNELREIIEDSINFDAPVVHIHDNIYALELFHGPTLAFKDFGARFMSRLISYLIRGEDKEITILVATSGDTGSAVARGFLGVPDIKVIILYPSGKVSELQEKQLTTMGQNITALEIKGVFDDCQKLVKTAFLDEDLNNKMMLASANSINIARLLPQSFYYFYAYAQLKKYGKDLVISVPSGNFGNLTAGLISKRMGLPIKKFIASTNINDVVPEYLKTAVFNLRASHPTISNAMDVGSPSNFSRILDLYDCDVDKMRQDIIGVSFTDAETKSAIKEVYQNHGYIMDPHGAVGYLGLKQYLDQHPDEVGVFAETAHPAKFKETVEECIDKRIDLPGRLEVYRNKEKQSTLMNNDFEEFKDYLMKR